MRTHKKIAFITTTFKNISNGPTKFARLLHSYSVEKEKDILFYSEDICSSYALTRKVVIPNFMKLPGIGLLYRIYKYYIDIEKNSEVSIVVSNNTIYLLFFYFFSKKKAIGFINDDEHLSNKIGFNYSNVRSFFIRNLEKISLNKNHFTIVNSEYLKNKIFELMKKESNIKTLYKGVNIDSKLNIDKHYDDKVFKIVFVKSNFKIGGLLTLLKAIDGLKNVCLDVVTSKRVLSSKAEMELIKNNTSINLHHDLEQNRVFELMKIAHCICIPSHKEALGVANMEAMVNSCIVVGTNVGGIPEVLDYGNAGVLFEIEDFVFLRSSIQNLHENRDFRISLVKNAYQHVQNFSISNTLSNFFKLVS